MTLKKGSDHNSDHREEGKVKIRKHRLKLEPRVNGKMLVYWPLHLPQHPRPNGLLCGRRRADCIVVTGAVDYADKKQIDQSELEIVGHFGAQPSPDAPTGVRGVWREGTVEADATIDSTIVHYETSKLPFLRGEVPMDLNVAKDGSATILEMTAVRGPILWYIDVLHSMTTLLVPATKYLYTAQLLHQKGQQIRRWSQVHSYSDYSRYLKARDACCMMLSDLLFGCAIGFAICWFSSPLSSSINNTLQWSVLYLEEQIVWLMGWPAGLKLNSNLGRFKGEMFLWLLSLWSVLMAELMRHMEVAVIAVGLAGLLGLSVLISMAVDLLALATFHFTYLYTMSTHLFAWNRHIFFSLFHLFYGKKWNVLRGRLDSAEYDVDQLLLGTILLSVVTFVFPTVTVYYFLFLGCFYLIQLSQMALFVLQTILQEFPLYQIFVRIFYPDLLVAGVHLQISQHRLILRLSPLSYHDILTPLAKSVGNSIQPLLSIRTAQSMIRGESLKSQSNFV